MCDGLPCYGHTLFGSIYMTNRGYCVRRCDVGRHLPRRDEPRSISRAAIQRLMCREIVVEVE